MVPQPRRLAPVGLLALLPALVYVGSNPDAFAAIAALNVLLIVGSLWSMTGPSESAARPGSDASH